MRYLALFLMSLTAACAPPVAAVSDVAVQPWPTYTDALPATPFNIDTLSRRTFNYFWELTDGFGQSPDRWPREQMSSIAATGFMLPALAVGVERGYVSRQDAAARARFTLQTLWDAPQGPQESGVIGYRGLFYHFLNHSDGLRYKNTELSTIDSGLLLAGVLAAQSYFDGSSPDEQAIRKLAEDLYLRVEWDFAFMDDGQLSMGWKPSEGFIKARWRGYNEASILMLLAMGSPTHPIPDTAWQQWLRTYDYGSGFGSEPHAMFDPLFGHQYSQMFVDFRGLEDDFTREHGIDYYENSVRATELQIKYAQQNPYGFAERGLDLWGLTACDGPGKEMLPLRDEVISALALTANGSQADKLYNEALTKSKDAIRVRGYWARGVDGHTVKDDGTVAPTAAGGSWPFAPAAVERTLAHQWNTYQPWLVGRYGFRDAFNLDASPRADQAGAPGWFNSDYLGIDQGPILLQLENHRTGMVWDLLKKSPHVRRGLRRADFEGGWLAEWDEVDANSKDQ